MEIRLLEAVDAGKYWELRLQALKDTPQAFGNTYETTLVIPDLEKQKTFANRIAGPDNFIVGAFDAGKLVGMAGFFRENGPKDRHKGSVWGMFVGQEARRQGTGKALVGHLIEQAGIIEGVEQIHLSVVTTQAAARKLYLGLGFRVYGTEPHALKVDGEYFDEDLMVLTLEKS